MSEWKEFKIGEITKKATSGGTPSTKVEEYYGGNIPWLNTKEVNFNRIWSTEKFITEKGLNNSSAKWIDQNSVIVAMYGATAAKVAINKIPLTTNQACCNLIIDYKRANYEFVFYYIWNKYEELENIAVGAAQQNLSVGVIADFPISLPPLPEQTAIASVLSSLDDKIDLLHRQNATLEKMAETLFRQWFVEEAKEEWDSDMLGNVFDIGIGRTPPRKEHHWFSENPTDIKWVSIKDMGASGVYISSVSEYLTQDAVDRFSIPIIPKNTVMLSFKMTIGRLAISTENMLSNEAIAHFKIKKDSRLFSEFLYLYLKTYQWEQLGSTSSIVEAINSQMIKEMEIFIPEVKTLNAFKEVVEPYFKKIKSNQTQIRTLTALRDTLLPKLMSGEVKVEVN